MRDRGGADSVSDAFRTVLDQHVGAEPVGIPSGIRDLVHALTERVGKLREGGMPGWDHLSPTTWRALPAEEAIKHSEDLVAAERAARLAVVAEAAAVRAFGRTGGLLTTDPEALALDHLRDVCGTDDLACNPLTPRNQS